MSKYTINVVDEEEHTEYEVARVTESADTPAGVMRQIADLLRETAEEFDWQADLAEAEDKDA